MALFGLHGKERAARVEEEEKHRLFIQKRQSQLGNTLVERLSRAAAENKVFNVLSNGDVNLSLGPIKIEAYPKKEGKFSVCVGLSHGTPLPQFARLFEPGEINYTMCDAEIDLTKNGQELRASGRDVDGDPYDDVYMGIEHIDEISELLEKRIKNYRVYGEVEEQSEK